MKLKFFSLVYLIFSLANCDTKKDPLSQENFLNNLLCYNYAACQDTGAGVKVGIVGDSWTDLLFGVPAIETLRIQMEKNHGYKMVGATQGGQTLARVLNSGLHLQTIDEAGASIRYMVISLGGNDLQGTPEAYVGKINEEKNQRFSAIRENLTALVLSGNAYKRNKYGGNSLQWFIHGYDYISPENFNAASPTSCRAELTKSTIGFTSQEVDTFATTTFNEYNEMIKNTAAGVADLYYIDLRGTLGGGTTSQPFSSPNLMFDCIHPNSVGFAPLATRFVRNMELVTGGDK